VSYRYLVIVLKLVSTIFIFRVIKKGLMPQIVHALVFVFV